MVGIYKIENGLRFTGIIANTLEDAEAYLGKKFGSCKSLFVKMDENNNFIYEDVFVPWYNKGAYKIMPLTLV